MQVVACQKVREGRYEEQRLNYLFLLVQAVNMMQQLQTLTGEEQQSASVDDEIIRIIVGDNHNNMLTDGDHDSENDTIDHQNIVEEQNEDPNNMLLANNIISKLDSAPLSDFVKHHTIFKVPESIRKINEIAYTPKLVAIGPFHRRRDGSRLQAMEKCKLIYVRDMLSRCSSNTTDGCSSRSTILKECVESIKIIEEKARRCYSEPINYLSSDEFVEMMVVDSLFIIELFLRENGSVIYDHDPFYSSTCHFLSLRHDVALLENQLPLFVVERLFKFPALRQQLQGLPITLLGLNFLNSVIPREFNDLEQYANCECWHLLDLLAKSFDPSIPLSNNNGIPTITIPTATELKNAGVKFRKGSVKKSFLDIKFSDDGVLEIPHINVEDGIESLLRNLIAREQCTDGDVNYFTAYASFMDDLINSASDVRLLRENDIIQNDLGNDEDVSNLFNNLCREIIFDTPHYFELQAQVNAYYKKRRNKWRATLMHDYFNSPWTIISVVAAILLIGLTIAQVILAALAL